MNKQQNTTLRLANIARVPTPVHEKLFYLEEQYGKYCYLPLHLSKIYDDKIVDWFFSTCKKIVKLKPDVADTEYGYSLFNSVNVCLDDRYRNSSPIWSDNQYPNFVKEFPHFYQQMMDQLPLVKIPRLSFWNSTRQIAPHRDHTCLLDMPNSFRIMVYDDNPQNTLFIQEDSDGGTGDKVYIKRYTETNTFVWNNLRVEHGSDYIAGHKKILLLLNDFLPDYKKYIDCIESSAAKYSSETVKSKLSLNNFIEL